MSNPDTEWITDRVELARLMALHNPKGEPVGDFTGRCLRCGSKDLWDDAPAAYGCNCCGAIFMTSDVAPHVIDNTTGEDLGPAFY